MDHDLYDTHVRRYLRYRNGRLEWVRQHRRRHWGTVSARERVRASRRHRRR
jgi:hypothetical protein